MPLKMLNTLNRVKYIVNINILGSNNQNSWVWHHFNIEPIEKIILFHEVISTASIIRLFRLFSGKFSISSIFLKKSSESLDGCLNVPTREKQNRTNLEKTMNEKHDPSAFGKLCLTDKLRSKQLYQWCMQRW